MELENVAEIEVEIQESGPAGEQGPPGLSAYEVYLVNGGTLSEKEWLESLKGETGQEGKTPVKGEDYFTEEDIASLKIPIKVSDLENDSGFISEVPEEYVTETELEEKGYATEKYVDDAVANINIPDVDFTGYATEEYVDNSITTLGNYVDEQLANIDTPNIDLSEYATVSYVDENSVPIYLFTNTDGLANMTESKITLGSVITNAITDVIKNAYNKGYTKFVIKMYYAKSTVTNFYGRCVELCFTISGTTITLVNRYIMSPYSGGYTRYVVTNYMNIVDGEIKGNSMNELFLITYLGDFKNVSGEIVTEEYVNNAVLEAKKSQIYQLSLTDKVSTSGRDLTTTELSEFKTICNNILASNDTNAQLKLYLKGDKYIGFVYPQIEYTSAKTIYEVLKSSGLKYLQGKLACSTNPAGTSYAFFDVTLSITGTYDGNTNTINITKTRVQSNVNNHVYNVMAIGSYFVSGSDVLKKTNTISYTPTGDYHPATKKYVDDSVAAAITTVLEAEY